MSEFVKVKQTILDWPDEKPQISGLTEDNLVTADEVASLERSRRAEFVGGAIRIVLGGKIKVMEATIIDLEKERRIAGEALGINTKSLEEHYIVEDVLDPSAIVLPMRYSFGLPDAERVMSSSSMRANARAKLVEDIMIAGGDSVNQTAAQRASIVLFEGERTWPDSRKPKLLVVTPRDNVVFHEGSVEDYRTEIKEQYKNAGDATANAIIRFGMYLGQDFITHES